MAETRFTALPDGREVAYRVVSESPGPVLVHTPSGMTPIEVLEEDPLYERFLRTLGGYGSVVVYDFLGKGGSDPFDDEVDFVDQNADCFVSVLDDCGVEAAWLVVSETDGAPLVARVAAHHRSRLAGAAILNPPGGRDLPKETILARDDDSNRQVLSELMPSRADDPTYRAWYERAGRLGGPAAAARALMEGGERSAPRVLNEPDEIVDPPPFLIVRRRERVHPAIVRWWSGRLPGAEVIVVEGADAFFNSADSALLADTIGAFVTGERRDSLEERPLLAVLFLDLVASTEHVDRVGDAAWSATLDGYERVVGEIVDRHAGAVVKHVGDGTLATFSSGSRAVSAVVAIRAALADLGLAGRFGVHVGEVEERDDDIGGVAVHLAARVMGAASPGQILVTSTVVGSVMGGPRRFESVGARALKGIAQPWELYALADEPDPRVPERADPPPN